MINLLSNDEKRLVTKNSLVDLEAQILVKMGFDFNFPGPMQSMERYLRILGYDMNSTISDMAFQICKFQLNDARFLVYKPSQIAACSVILAINILQTDKDLESNDGFFNNCKFSNGMQELNLHIRNN